MARLEDQERELFTSRSGSDNAKRAFIEGPVDIMVDRDDCDSAFVDDLLPFIVRALNGTMMQRAVRKARAAQRKRFAVDEDGLPACGGSEDAHSEGMCDCPDDSPAPTPEGQE